MLQIEANAVTSEAFATSLSLLEREMDIVLQHLTNLGTEAALVAGFVFVIFTNEIKLDNEAMAMMSMGSAVSCFGSMMYVVVCATISCSLGPMLGLKGSDPSAMRRAVEAMPVTPAFALIDGNRIPHQFPCPAQAIVKGDARSASIAAASIIAKVTRDRIMAELAKYYPGYGWERNAGYGVPAHREALKSLGVTPHHRRSFKPIHNMLC